MNPNSSQTGATGLCGLEVDDFVASYESASAVHGQADIKAFLPERDHPLYSEALCELVRVDLELSWERPPGKRLEEYQAYFPELFANREALQAMAFEEYRLRRLAGEKPTHLEYRQRFGVNTDGWPGEAIRKPGSMREPVSQAAVPSTLGARVEAVTDSGSADAPSEESIAGAAHSYRQFRLNDSGTDDKAIESWCASFRGSAEHAEFFRDVHRTDPEKAYQLAEAVTRLPEVGTKFLGFRLLEELGKGAFGKVYLAEQGDLANRFVALKIAGDIYGESQTLAQLQHTNIVPIFSIHSASPFQAVCMPYFGATTLADVLHHVERGASLPASGKILVSTVNDRKSNTRLPHSSKPSSVPHVVHSDDAPTQSFDLPDAPPKENDAPVTLKMLEGLTYVEAVLWMAARLADGLAYAHDRGIVHRDLKPANILLTDEGQPMLLDFNLSEDTKSRAAAASVGGTLPFMAPEHLRAFRGEPCVPDARSDIYSLGVIFYEMLTGKPPFRTYGGVTSSVLACLIADRLQPVPHIRQFNPAVSPAVAAIIHHCLEAEPERRYQTARELQEDLERHLQHLPLKHIPEPSLAERARKWFRRHPSLASSTSIAAFAAILLMILAAMFVVRGQRLARLQATDSLSQFHEEFKTIQALLYARHANREQLQDGMQRCRGTLERYQVLENPDWASLPDVYHLPVKDREHLQEQVGELLFLLARATRLEAEHHCPKPDQPEQLRLALSFNSLAEACYQDGKAPRALWEQRSEINKLLGRHKPVDDGLARARQTALKDKDYYLLAHDHAIRGSYRQALDLLQKATQKEPQNFSGWFVRGNCYYELLQDGDAVACFNTCVALRPEFHWSWFNRALAHFRLRNYRQAEEDLDQVIRLQPQLADAFINRALVRQGLGKHEEAVADFTQALELGSSSTRIYFLRAAAREKAGDQTGARLDFELGLEREPGDEPSWVARGLARRNSDPKGALADFEQALKLNPRSFEGLQNKAAILVDKFNKDSEALAVMDKAVQLYPDSVLARGGRGVLLARAGQRSQAIQDAEQALLLDPRPPTLYQAACIFALTSKTVAEDRLRAFQLLSSALKSGFGLEWLATDTDLDPLRKQPEFARLVTAAQELQPAKRNARP